MLRFTTDIIATLRAALSSYDYDRLFVVADTRTASVCVPLLGDALAPTGYRLITIEPGDEHKTLATLAAVWDALVEGGATRHSLLLCVGGGVVTDLGGFAAATFKRGIRYVNIPTTLLAMVDAAVGGKTAIDYRGLKNEIGAFYTPSDVILCPDFLATLDADNQRSGIAEMLKHALLGGADTYAAFMSDDLLDDTFVGSSRALQLISDSVWVKRRIVEQDPCEKGLRKALNLGHTVGHALESWMLQRGTPVLHGVAVAWGLTAELYLSHVRCSFPVETLRTTARYVREHFPPCPATCSDYDALYALMLHDKKNVEGQVRFALLAAPGSVQLDVVATKDEIFEAIDFLREG